MSGLFFFQNAVLQFPRFEIPLCFDRLMTTRTAHLPVALPHGQASYLAMYTCRCHLVPAVSPPSLRWTPVDS
jgi:hypothetical protein